MYCARKASLGLTANALRALYIFANNPTLTR